MLGWADQEAYADELYATYQGTRFEPDPCGRAPEFCRWCGRHYTAHEHHTTDCVPLPRENGQR